VLWGRARADDRLLDGRRGILGDRKPRLLGGEEHDPSGVSEHERGVHVLMVEGVLEGEDAGAMPRDQLVMCS